MQKTLQAFSAFINPSEVENGDLVSLSSGLKVFGIVANDLKAKEHGKASFETFVETG